MQFQERLRKAVSVAARDFNHALTLYEPTHGANPYPERMVSYYYIRALADALSPASVVLEVPVTSSRAARRDNHVDALVFNYREMVLAEFKRAWTQSHWSSLAADLKRLGGPAGREIKKRFRAGYRRRSYLFLGADCWYRAVAEAWASGSSAMGWTVPASLRKAQRDYLKVYSEKGSDYDGYYLTWALFCFDEKGARSQ